MKKKTYTAPAVIACTDAVQNTKLIGTVPADNGPGEGVSPGGIGFYL